MKRLSELSRRARIMQSVSRDQPACLLCHAPLGDVVFPFATVWNGQEYWYRHCSACGSSTVDPLPDDLQLRVMYSWSAYHQEHYSNLTEEVTPSALDGVLPALVGCQTLLDFGCGNGSFLRLAREAGFTCQGVELDEASRLVAEANSGCPVVSLEEILAAGKKFDVIHLGDVLEHLRDPAITMLDLEALLSERGRFFVEGPLETNTSLVLVAAKAIKAVRSPFGKRSIGTLPPFHLFQTNAAAQRDFFAELLGYEMERYIVWESGWPYRLRRPANSKSEIIRDLIGRAAVGTERIGRVFGLKLGNRFAAVVRPREMLSF